MLNISHWSGGRVTAITAIAHQTREGVVTSHFIGKVTWDKGGEQQDPDRLYDINPALLFPNGDGNDLCKALAALREYKRINGDWVGDEWKPHSPCGRAEMNL